MNDEKEQKRETEDEFSFRRVLHGYAPQEVADYIEELTRTMQDASRNYEQRMAEMKQELAFAVRERDSLRAKLTEPNRSPRENSSVISEAPAGESLSEDTQETGKLLAEARAENGELTLRLGENAEKLAALSSLLNDKEKENAGLRDRLDALGKQLASAEELRTSYEDAAAEKEKLLAAASARQEELELLQRELKDAEERYAKKENELNALRTELNRAELENSLLREKSERCSRELSVLKADAKAKAYENAEKLSAEREEFNREKTEFMKQVQLQNYHIELAQAAAEELKVQLAQISSAFEK